MLGTTLPTPLYGLYQQPVSSLHPAGYPHGQYGYPGAVPAVASSRKEVAMSYARQLLDTYPRTFNVDAGVLAATTDALTDCAQACTADADDDLSEQNLAELVKCV